MCLCLSQCTLFESILITALVGSVSHISHLCSRMHTTSGHEGHKQHRSQTLPIIRGKNALSNPKLLQMLDNTMNSK